MVTDSLMCMRGIRAALALAGILVASAACGSSPNDRPAVGNGPISFSRFEPGAAHIYLIDPAGGAPRQMTFGTGFQSHSAWSPDGTQVAFDQITADGASIMRINADGTGTMLLNKGTPWSTVPSWSPDGSRVAFTSDADGNDEIYTMAADGTDVTQVTFTDPPTLHSGPKYSPDGAQILFALKRPQDIAAATQDLWVMNADGSSEKQLTFGYNNNESRTWSPDIATNTVVTSVSVGGGPLRLAITPSGAAAYVTNYNGGGGNSVLVVSLPFVPKLSSVFTCGPSQVVPGQRGVEFCLTITNAGSLSKSGSMRASAEVNGNARVMARGSTVCTVRITNGTGSCRGTIPAKSGKLVFSAKFTGTVGGYPLQASLRPSGDNRAASRSVAISASKSNCSGPLGVAH